MVGFGSVRHRFGSAWVRFGIIGYRFGSAAVRFGIASARFGGNDFFGSVTARFGTICYRFGSATVRFGVYSVSLVRQRFGSAFIALVWFGNGYCRFSVKMLRSSL